MMDEKRQLMRKKSFEVSEEWPSTACYFVMCAILFMVSIAPLVYMIGRRILRKQRPPTDCGSGEKEEIVETKAGEDETKTSTAAWEQGSFNHKVFISFRGTDTRNGFTSHLYKELAETRGITTFIDSEDLKKGKKISDLIKHIEGSKIFLPVFSKNYAGSKWCLREIAKMVEINKREGEKRPIIPVFYDVDPSDVKDPKSSFGKALKILRHDDGLSKEQINEWRSALTEAGNISGFCLNETKGNEAKLITLISKDVSNILCKVPFNIQPIGIGPCIDTLKQMLAKEKEGVCMIGICGLGGIGKTTLAMALYNELSLAFESSCFLPDIRDNENKDSLHSLQAKLMKKVLGENIHVDKVEEGVNLIRQRFRSKKILLILDDVDDTRQLEAFTAKIGEKVQWFGAGSKIIVTTRDEQVLTSHGLQREDIYFPEGLDVDHSLKLFCHHTFHRDQPSAAFGELSQQVVGVAHGLPLALKVFGSLFWDLKEKPEWEEMLEKLKCDQHKEIHERLKVSYDSLDHSEKSVFLDITCFFIFKNKEYPVYMWKACGYFPTITLKVLQNKSLIKINMYGDFEMHDQIRDMGRMIVKEEGNSDPLKYSRPWSTDQISEVLRDAKVSLGNPYIQGIHSNRQLEMSWRVIEAMPKLRMITSSTYKHHWIEDEEETIRLPSNIRWLEWRGCPYQTLTFHNNKHEQLCVLNLSNGGFRYFGSHRMVFPKLKVLNLYGCQYLLQTPDFSHLRSLEKLSLDYCLSLTQIDESIGQLEKLVELSFSGCKKLRGLPAGLCKLSSLESLDLLECQEISVLPTQLGNLRSLKYLNLKRTSISDVPNSIGGLQSLEMLDLAYCRRISTLPKQIGDLTSLKYLDLTWTSISDITNSIGSLQSLEKLNLAKCEGISTLPRQIGNLTSLKYLDLQRTSISDVPNSIGSLQSLEQLGLNGCKGISILPKQIEDLTCLKELGLRGTSISALPDSIGSLHYLEKLDLSGCTSLQKIPDSIGDLKSLMWLSLTKCKLLVQLPNSMGMLTSLKRLDIDHCISLREVPDSLGDLNNGFQISLEGCILLEKLPNNIRIVGVKFLHKLQFDGLASLRRLLDILGDAATVHSVSLRDCASLKELPDSIGLRMMFLRGLDLSGCTLLGRIPISIGDLKMLNCLSLSGCRSLEELPECTGRLLSLEKLDLSGCILLTTIPETIRYLSRLMHLSLRDCQSLNKLPECIGRLLFLKVLDLSGCTSIKSIPESMRDLKILSHLSLEFRLWDSIVMFTSLRELHLSSCSPLNRQSLKKLPESMEGLISLRMLIICGGMSNKLPDFMLWGLMDCQTLVLSELEEIPELVGEFCSREAIVIEDCPKLESFPQLPCHLTYLGILGCAAFRKLADPSTLNCLKSLVLEGCKAFTDLSGLGSLQSLRKLALVDRDGLSRDLMDKLSQASFKQLKALFISGASDGSNLLFGLPKSNVGQVQGLEGMCCLTEKLPFDASDINICIQVLVEGAISTEVTCIQTGEEDQGDDTDDDDDAEDDDAEGDNAKELGKWVLGDQDIYEIYAEEGKEIVQWVGEGNKMLRIPTTYNYYRLRMAFLEVAYGHLLQELPMRWGLWS